MLVRVTGLYVLIISDFFMIYFFSGTGNSMAIAKMLAKQLDDRMMSVIEALEQKNLFVLMEDEPLGFVFPVYSWGPPEVVLRLLASLKLSEAPSYLYFVCTCGDDTGKTADVFSKAASQRGWICRAGFSVTMPNTYVCLPGFDVDADELKRRKLAHAAVRVVDLVQSIKERVTRFDCHEGGFPRLKTYAIRPLFNRLLMSPKPFRVTDDCVSCGKCIRSCPTKNIRWKDGRPSWSNNCTMCLACYHHCPKHAVEYGSQTKHKGQYTFPF